ncbi:bifunctional folylpolyglutamate synthase/dihydrofolate synthase [Rubrivirga litoralis]|uniref:Dihydrofolate synthase/folylpolyglutamate synthase n=1 Tax=Rubrivirga litoralis TaxID=3075598 RepID=A0ABU3BQY9_9BACT|nr:Mur ligase family protein [Rubrivirga sp. F394]MDT0631708.1 Mur ligase family protein [Rubrivirga sp. F394]
MPTASTAEDRLLALPRFADAGAAAYKPGLERMRALLAALDDPHLVYPTVHVAGTNGKGSTASFAASVAQAAGLRVGLHTSPHLVSLRERMRIDGRPAPPAWLDGAVDRWGGAVEAVGPSFFEATVALSLLYFAEQDVDLAVVEVGLGGRLDATNVLVPCVAAVTHVGLDHTDLLGATTREIAREKAGIAKPGVPLLHAVADADARDSLETEARGRGGVVEAVRETCRVEPAGVGSGGAEAAPPGSAPPGPAPPRVCLVTPLRDYGPVVLGLPGPHQAWNAALAVRAAEVASPAPPTPEAVRAGLAEVARRTGLRGRGGAWAADPRVVLDVAHNADGWRAALDAVAVPEGGRLWVLAGVLADKDAAALGALLARRPAGLPSAHRVLAAGLEGERALSAEALAEALGRGGADAEPAGTPAEALRRFQDAAGPADRLLVTGSHQTVAAVLQGEP